MKKSNMIGMTDTRLEDIVAQNTTRVDGQVALGVLKIEDPINKKSRRGPRGDEKDHLC